jgi:lysophospholipase L1-like esterase
MSIKGAILFGDSVFFGIGASSKDKGCGRQLKKIVDLPIFIKSHNLDTSRDGLNRLNKDVLECDDILFTVIMFGNNDCRLNKQNIPNVSLQEYKYNLKMMVKKIKSAFKIPLICNLHPISTEGFFRIFPEMRKFADIYPLPSSWQEKYSDICGELCTEENIFLVDIRTPLKKNINSILAKDGLHPNDLGHNVIAKELERTLKKIKIE